MKCYDGEEQSDYSVAFESIDFAVSVETGTAHEAAREAIRRIPDWMLHKRHGGVEVICPDGTVKWFQPTTQLVELDEDDEPILEHNHD